MQTAVNLAINSRSTESAILQLSDNEVVGVVVAYCKEDLSYLDRFGCNRLQFIIMSKCGAPDPEFSTISNCVTIHHIENCGTEGYAYFKYVESSYESLPFAMVAFIQGGALTENPHLRHDILRYLPGTYYTDLARVVGGGWHMDADPVRESMIQRVAPDLLNHSSWLTNWRGQFMASRDALQRVPKEVYTEFNANYCNESCVANDCSMEVWTAAMFQCVDTLFMNELCQVNEHDLSAKVIPSDFRKDGNGFASEGMAWRTTQKTCGNRSIFYSESEVNGRFFCVERNTTHTVDLWRAALYELYAEREEPQLPSNLSSLEWKWERQVAFTQIK
ncbi:hypothetical protein MHU86_3225 [Fragilaria crotonensis]|nr:hypothetical protein MHU86_3225 [Fragilaria crotonensis]